MIKQKLRWLIVFTGILVGSCSPTPDAITPTVQDITESVYASGVIKAGGQYDVFAPYSGILTRNLVKAGDSIAPGTPLFEIDNTVSSLTTENARINADLLREKTGPQSNTLTELEKRTALAREKMLNDSLLFSRQQNLWKEQVGSRMELEKRELTYKASRTEYESLQLQFRQTKMDLEKAYRQAMNNVSISEKQKGDFTVRSQISGTIYSVLKEPGEWISIQTPLGVAGESGRFELELQVDEYDIVKVKPDQRIYVTMDSYRGQVFEARVTRVEPFMNPRTRTFTIYAEFITKPDIIYPNLSVEANILIAVHKKALTIPSSHLLKDQYVLTPNKDTISVKTGIRNLQWVEILEGLSEQSEIISPIQ